MYYCLQIYESETVRGVVSRWRQRRLYRRGMKLRDKRKRIDDALRYLHKGGEKERTDA